MVQTRFIIVSLIAMLLLPWACRGSSLDIQPYFMAQVDRLMEESMARGTIAGGVVLVGTSRGVIFQKPYGRVASEAAARPMTVDSIFDVASLTKVVATAPSILKLAEEGRLSLTDPVRKWIPEFAPRDDLMVWHLLTHTSGLDDFSLSSANPLQSAVDNAAAQRPKAQAGSRFRYADINFILLAEIVRRVSGMPLDQYAGRVLFEPLGMSDTQFNPDQQKALRCTATISGENSLVGQAQDYLARQLGGVAGHAGLFATVGDLSRFCMMILNQGELNGKRIFSPRTVDQMTAPYFSRGGGVVRGLGWDISSPFSAPRGSGFSEVSFGHTGYSGSSLWLDPGSDLFVVLLTSRIDYRRPRELGRLRSDISTVVAAQLAPQRVLSELIQAVSPLR